MGTVDINLYSSAINITPFYAIAFAIGLLFTIVAIKTHHDYPQGERMSLIPPIALALTAAFGFIMDEPPFSKIYHGGIEVRSGNGVMCFFVVSIMLLLTVIALIKYLIRKQT